MKNEKFKMEAVSFGRDLKRLRRKNFFFAAGVL